MSKSKKTYFLIKKKAPVQHTYKVKIEVTEDDELIMSHSSEVIGNKVTDVLSLLDIKVRDIWTQIKQMAHVADSPDNSKEN